MNRSDLVRRRGAAGIVATCALALLPLLGCNNAPPVGEVAGTVTLDGDPYSDADVIFMSPETGQAGSAPIQSDGTFRLESPLPTGTYKVYLAPPAAPIEEAAPTPVSIDQSVPQKYWNEATTDITATVNEGENTVNVELESA